MTSSAEIPTAMVPQTTYEGVLCRDCVMDDVRHFLAPFII